MVFDLGKKYIQEKEYNKALSFFLNELENGNKTANIYYLLGFIYYSLNQIQNSINYYKLALKINPKSIDLILHLANAHTVIGNFLSAKKLCLKAIDLDKLNPKAYYSLYMIKPQYLTSEHILNLIEAKKCFHCFKNVVMICKCCSTMTAEQFHSLCMSKSTNQNISVPKIMPSFCIPAVAMA